jgi:hypothetical protein
VTQLRGSNTAGTVSVCPTDEKETAAKAAPAVKLIVSPRPSVSLVKAAANCFSNGVPRYCSKALPATRSASQGDGQHSAAHDGPGVPIGRHVHMTAHSMGAINPKKLCGC